MFLLMICAILFRLFDVLTHDLCYPFRLFDVLTRDLCYPV